MPHQQNLEQIRATNALAALGRVKVDKRDVSKLPAMILTNGLLAAAAFANEGERKSGIGSAMDEVAEHLRLRGMITNAKTSGLLRDLMAQDSHHLQRATSEALAFLGYLKRFAVKGRDASET